MRRILRISALALAASFFPGAITSYPVLAGNDTPKDVAYTAAEARRDSQTVNRDSDRFLARVANDRRFTSKLMEVAKGKDKEAIARFVKESIGGRSEITVEDIDTDWCLTIRLKFRRFKIVISIGTTCRG